MPLSLSLLLGATLACAPSPAPQAPLAKPRLVVVLSIDQFRADYLTRFAAHYLPAKQGATVGGFKLLTEGGANYIDCHYWHAQTATGPGHAAIMTGSVPAINGIVGNAWFDRTTKKNVYVVDDLNVKTVGGTSSPMGPFNLKVTTVGDELEMATNGQAKTVSIALKDRSAILMAGHAGDTVLWYETPSKKWVTSTHYAPDGALPKWVSEFNGRKLPDAYGVKTWVPLLEDAKYTTARTVPFEKRGTAPVFKHPANGDIWGNSFGNEFVIETAKQAVVSESLGQDDVPDVLTIGFSSNDYVGHKYGPNSPEVMDMSVRSDRLLSDLFNFLDKNVSGGLGSVVIALTADHGVVPIVEESRDAYKNTTLVRDLGPPVVKAIKAALAAKYGPGEWVLAGDFDVCLDQDLIASKKLDLREVQRTAAAAAASVPGIYCSFAAKDIEEGRLPKWPWIELVYNGYSPKYSGDTVSFENPGSYPGGGTGTGHGSPWPYDTHVPMVVWGGGVRPGRYPEKVRVSDLAPTLSAILGIEQPSGCVGTPLSALGR